MTFTLNTLLGHVPVYRYASLVEDAEFERLQSLMDEAERKDALVQKLDSVSKLEVREDAGGEGGGGDAEFERLQRLMDKAENKDALVQKLDSVSKLEVRGRWREGGSGG